MEANSTLTILQNIMLGFAQSTGLSPVTKSPRRYLWTDAFAVCNFLELYDQTQNEQFKQLALQLVEQVHQTLGRHRNDDMRCGWISGLEELEGKIHPTIGGLRIGKQNPERGTNEPLDEYSEWDNDGQYYHYLTKWMHALNQVGMVLQESKYINWAMELAKTIHLKFTYKIPPSIQLFMYWKMSIDLTRPLMPSMGHHDPLDGLVTYQQLQSTKDFAALSSAHQNLSREIEELQNICQGKDWFSDDPLGIGSLLCDAARVAQMTVNGRIKGSELLDILIEAAAVGLNIFNQTNLLSQPPDYRLAFRELGLSIGLKALDSIQELVNEHPIQLITSDKLPKYLNHLTFHAHLANDIETFWLQEKNQNTISWKENQDINSVMLATSLAPNGFLTIFPKTTV